MTELTATITCHECRVTTIETMPTDRFRLFVNVENLANVRQTDWNPLIRPRRAADGRWTVDAWAPLDGRVLNGGLRLQF